MIKFFRKIRKSLLIQNKSGKYLKYAIGEIALVMIGILLALQVNNWNNIRINKKKERAILKELHIEFLQNKIQLDSVITYHKIAFEGTKKLIALFPIDIKKINLDSIENYLNDMLSSTFTYNPSQGVINSLISTSDFDIISNDNLRKTLISWPDLVVDFQEDENDAKNVVIDLIDPVFSKKLDFRFNFTDKRNDLKFLETLEFEYLIQLRHTYFKSLFKEGAEAENVIKNIDLILNLTKIND